MFTRSFQSVQQHPRFRTLRLRIPLAIGASVGEKPLLRASFLFVAPSTAEQGVNAQFIDRVDERDALQHVAACVRTRLFVTTAAINRILNIANEQLRADRA